MKYLILPFLFCSTAALAQVTSGTIKGVVTDEFGTPLGGVLVVATGPSTQGEETATTDASGQYSITDLPPGVYQVAFTLAQLAAEQPAVELHSEQTLALNMTLVTVEGEMEVITVTGTRPTVDVGSTQLLTQVKNDLVRNVPIRGRTYESLLTMAPGAAEDAVGTSFGGATGAENIYLVDGLNTTDNAYGLIGTRLSLEFLEETNIITAGYRAEYGRATGAIVSLVTKSGGNELKGSVWFNSQPLQLTPARNARLGEAISTIERPRDRAYDFGFELGGPIIEDAVWFYAGVAPSFTTDRYQRIIRARTGAQDENGVFLTQDIDGSEQTLESTSRLLNYIAKLDFRFDDDHKASLSYLGSPSSFSGVFNNPNNSHSLGLGFNADPSSMTFQETIAVHDVIGRMTSKFLERKLRVQLTAGFHSQQSRVDPSAQQAGSVQDERVVSLTQFEDVAACSVREVDGADFDPCPVSSYEYGGFGFFNALTNQRAVVALDGTYFADLAGIHALKIGGDFEHNYYRNHRSYTGGVNGGAFHILDAAGGIPLRQQFGTIDPTTGEVVLTPDGFTAETRTTNESLYLQDSYSPAFVPGLTVDVGLRWELQQLMDVDGNVAFSINDNISPRIGLIYDLFQDSTSKIFANYGRFFESIPLDVNDRAFAKEALVYQTLLPGDPGYCGKDAAGATDTNTCRYSEPTRDDAFGGALAVVQPGLKGQFSDQVVAGIEHDVGRGLVLGSTYIHKNLGRIIEDISPDGGQTYLIANPGEGSDPAIASFPKPTRNYNALVLTARKSFAGSFQLLGSYTYSRTVGNYPGLYQESNEQLDPNVSTQYDLKDLLPNRDGPLPTDRPHNFKLLASYFWQLGAKEGDGFTIGLGFDARSGTPIDVLGRHPIYGERETFLLPRGSGGRTPWRTQLDLHLGYATELVDGYELEVVWDVFNVFNQRAVASVDAVYTNDTVTPIVNGRWADLANLKNTSGQGVSKNPNYGHATAHQDPLAMRFGARVSF